MNKNSLTHYDRETPGVLLITGKKAATFSCVHSVMLSIIFTLCSFVLTASTFYIAPSGNDNNKGTKKSPFASLNKAWTNIKAGDVVYLRGGIYAFNSQQRLTEKNGTAGNLIKIWAYPGESPIVTRGETFHYSSTDGIYFSGNYVHFKGLEIQGFYQTDNYVFFGFLADNSNNCIFELLNIHDNGCGMGLNHKSSGNLILNCDFHHNSDPKSKIPFDNADGLDIAYVPAGSVNTVRGCRSWWNSDDGFDCWKNDGKVYFDHCWSFWNGYFPGSFRGLGNGDGFKLGPTATKSGSAILRTVTHCIAYKNKMRGIDQNLADCIMILYNNTTYNNGARGFDFFFGTKSIIAKNNLSFRDGNTTIFKPQSLVDHNSWNGRKKVSKADFISLSPIGINGPRQPDGSLPVVSFLNLRSGSALINSGIDVGLPFKGSAPDLGAFEHPGDRR